MRASHRTIALLRAALALSSALLAGPMTNAAAEPPRAETRVDGIDRSNLVLTFDDEFDSFSWDDPRKMSNGDAGGGRWRTWYRNSSDPYGIHTRTLPGNSEMQVYGDPALFEHFRTGARAMVNPVYASGGALHLRAVKAPKWFQRRAWGRQYLSGMVTNWGSFSQLYGVFEMRAKLPAGRGLWPAFWLMPADGSWPPEIDIFEVLGHNMNEINVGFLNGPTEHRTGEHHAAPTPDLSADFHTYALDWSPQRIIYYLDGAAIANWPTPPDVNKPSFIIINLAVGGKWPGAPDAATHFPATMDIDWVRVYRRAGASGSQKLVEAAPR